MSARTRQGVSHESSLCSFYTMRIRRALESDFAAETSYADGLAYWFAPGVASQVADDAGASWGCTSWLPGNGAGDRMSLMPLSWLTQVTVAKD